MTFDKALESESLLLPKAIPPSSSYRKFLAKTLEDYIRLLKTITDKTIEMDGFKQAPRFKSVISFQEEVVRGILETIDCYFDGSPSKAYERFDMMIKARMSKYRRLLNIKTLDPSENFYRLRIKKENFPLAAKEMFHIPFEHRGKVSTQRYSIPGFPCLYMGKTIYVAWEELKRPNLDEFQVVRLKSTKEIKLLNLTGEDWGGNAYHKIPYKYLMTWPIIAACSLKVQNYNDAFKPEYIIPQLLLQWVRNNQQIVDGIMYNSTHIPNKKLTTEGQVYNVVLPVKDNGDKGHCKHLMNMFETTETISKQLMDYSSGGSNFLYTEAELKKIDKKIPALEIIKGQKSAYSNSILGMMELKLGYMPTKKIE